MEPANGRPGQVKDLDKSLPELNVVGAPEAPEWASPAGLGELVVASGQKIFQTGLENSEVL
ncbi:MAG: hypothetical protein ACYC9D_08165 [Candidatus Dormibacteria bacterium]